MDPSGKRKEVFEQVSVRSSQVVGWWMQRAWGELWLVSKSRAEEQADADSSKSFAWRAG
jgi:hypothetical protein